VLFRSRLIAFLERLPLVLTITAGSVLVAAIGLMDYVTGYQLSFSAFYLLPLFAFAWLLGRWGGIGGALASAAVRTLADLLGGHVYAHVSYAAWNALMRLVLFLVVARLISVLKEHVDHERTLARIDHLTGAANKRSFIELLKAEADRSRRYARRFTVAYFDLDNFKVVNDSLGHAAGDELLQTVVTVMRAGLRVTDVVARLGGDEFALLLPETDERAARVAIAKIQEQIGRAMKERSWPVTVSVGSLTCAGSDGDVEKLIEQADDLMYAAKLKGKNTVQYSG
jgi:diguanylate cyclase (GGDEF)-like protein